eukprot:14481033-Alexandrium_andersonii.AAC.1
MLLPGLAFLDGILRARPILEPLSNVSLMLLILRAHFGKAARTGARVHGTAPIPAVEEEAKGCWPLPGLGPTPN